MKIATITLVISLSLAASAAAQGSASGNRASPEGSSKSPFTQARALANELQGQAEKLGDLVNIYRSLLERRPQLEGKSPEQKQAHDEQIAKWSNAIERQLTRIEQTRGVVVETMERLDRTTKGQSLPTSLAKDVANARNEADAQRAAADQALKSKPKLAPKGAKPAPKRDEQAPPLDDDLDL